MFTLISMFVLVCVFHGGIFTCDMDFKIINLLRHSAGFGFKGPDGYKKSVEMSLEQFIKESKNADIVGGCIITESDGIVGQAISIAKSSLFGVGGVEFRNNNFNKPIYVNTLAFGAHKREFFSEIGGYDEDMVCNQDDEFNHCAIQS